MSWSFAEILVASYILRKGMVNVLTGLPAPCHNPCGDAPSMIKRTRGWQPGIPHDPGQALLPSSQDRALSQERAPWISPGPGFWW
jgi:hypothetical protein